MKRISAFSLSRLAIVALVYSGMLGIAILLDDALNALFDLEFGWLIIIIVALAMVAVARLWPSFRLLAFGVALFWSASIAIVGIPILRHGEWGIWEILVAWSFVGFLASLAWGAFWTAIFRRSLPLQPDGEQCVQCGYDLRGLPHPRCPECGEANHVSSDGATPGRRIGPSVNRITDFSAGRLACIAFASALLWIVLSAIPGAVDISDSHLSHSATSCSVIVLAIIIQIILWPSYRLFVISLMLNGVLPIALVKLLNTVFGLPPDVSSFNAWFRAELIPLHGTVLIATLVWGTILTGVFRYRRSIG